MAYGVTSRSLRAGRPSFLRVPKLCKVYFGPTLTRLRVIPSPVVGGSDWSLQEDAPVSSSITCTEKLLDLSQLLSEARSAANDFVFTDTDIDEPVWEHENRFSNQSPQNPAVPRQDIVKSALDPTLVDITSAYSVEQGFQEVEVQQLAAAMGDNSLALLLDVRSEEERNAEGNVAGARHISMSKLSDAVREGVLDDFRDASVAIICTSGSRSAQATVRLTRVFGFKDVRNVKGGMRAWRAAGLPLEGAAGP